MNRHDSPTRRVAVLRAMLRYPALWLDTVSIGATAGIGTRTARVELRALRREWLVKRCARGRWLLRDPQWARDLVRSADETAQFHRDRLAAKAEQVRLGAAPPPPRPTATSSPVMTMEEIVRAGGWSPGMR